MTIIACPCFPAYPCVRASVRLLQPAAPPVSVGAAGTTVTFPPRPRPSEAPRFLSNGAAAAARMPPALSSAATMPPPYFFAPSADGGRGGRGGRGWDDGHFSSMSTPFGGAPFLHGEAAAARMPPALGFAASMPAPNFDPAALPPDSHAAAVRGAWRCSP